MTTQAAPPQPLTTSPSKAQETLAQQYQRQGYLVVPQLFTPEECQQFKLEGQRLLAELANKKSSVYVGVAADSPLFYRMASDARITRVLAELLPTGADFMSDKFVWKSPQHRFATPWHQDIAYWPGTRPKISTWVALDDTDAANGAMRIIPRSHLTLLPHEFRGEGSVNGEFGNVIVDLEETNQAPGELVCELKAGGVLFFSDMLAHASCTNASGRDRYAHIGTYHASGPDEEFDLMFPARHTVWQPG